MKKFMVFALVIGLLALSACDSTTPTGGDTSETTVQNEVQEIVLVDNDDVKVSFIELYEEPSISGAAYLRLKVENKTGKTVTVYPKDVYINDTSTILGSGVPMTLAPGKNSQTPFIIFYANIGITSKDEIQKIEFKLTFDDENYDLVTETEVLVIELEK